jgi:hypothetical protein
MMETRRFPASQHKDFDMPASQKADFTKTTLMALMTAQADRAELDRQKAVALDLRW